MKISGFTYVRNGFEFGYPFIQAIQSVLPIVEEMIVVVGDSTDGTKEAVLQLNSPKIKIIDTVWDLKLKENGKIFAQQANIGLDNATGDWLIHIQADEVIHENDIFKIKEMILEYDEKNTVEGFILPFYHFFGDYCYIRNTRGTHRYEVRIIRNNRSIRSYRDSQGFRKYKDKDSYNSGEKGEKLKVLKIDAPVYHYSYVRPPKLMSKKAKFWLRFYDKVSKENQEKVSKDYDYNNIDKLTRFNGEHPVYMKEIIKNKDWDFEYDSSKSKMRLKDKILDYFAQLSGIYLFEYKNYKLISSKK